MSNVLKRVSVTIITINYNNAAGLEETICSVIGQSYADIQFIVIDGGSTDGSAALIQTYTDKIDYWVTEKDNGVYHAMNKGIQASTGDYLLFINSGDRLTDSLVIENAVKSDLDKDLVTANLWFVKDGVKREWVPSGQISFRTFLSNTLPHPCTFIKRSLFAIVGLYNEQHKIVSDWEFFLLATCKYNCSYKHINLFLTDFNEEGISSDPENFPLIEMERNTVLMQNFPYFLEDYKQHKFATEELGRVKYVLRLKNFFRGSS